MAEVKIPDAGGATMDMLDVGGFTHPVMLKVGPECQQMFDNVPNFNFRYDDLMLCSFPKTGSNWTFEILMMILNRSAKRVEANKAFTMLECFAAEDLDKKPSPRVVNCHYAPRYLPLADMKEKQIKTVLCLRNPKDTAVSYYNHMKGFTSYSYDGKWEDWLPVYAHGKLEYEKYSDYLLEWQREVQDGPGFPLHIMFYEDLKMNGREELDKLLTFLDIKLDEQLKNDIIDMCGFEKTKKRTKCSKNTENMISNSFVKVKLETGRTGLPLHRMKCLIQFGRMTLKS